MQKTWFLACVVGASRLSYPDQAAQDDAKYLDRALQAAISKGDHKEVRRLAGTAVKNGTPEHTQTVLRRLPGTNLRIYWTLMETLHAVETEAALSSVADEVVALKDKPEAGDLAFIVLGSKLVTRDKILSRLLAEGNDRVRIACVIEIVAAEKKEFIPQLIHLLEAEEKKAATDLRRELVRGLRNFTGLDLGPTSAPWKRWWEKNGFGFECPKIGETNKGSTETVVATLRRDRATQYEELKRGKKTRIAVVRSTDPSGDRIDTVLDALSIPYVLVSNNSIVSGTVDAESTFAILENCIPDGIAGSKLQESARTFVSAGGYLLATDWALESTLWPSFPGYCKPGAYRIQREAEEVCPGKGLLTDRFMRDVWRKGYFDKWVMHSGGVGVRVVSDQVTILIEGPDLGSRPGASAPLLGYFRYGTKGGCVAFVASHFAMQKTQEGEFTFQNILLNFLIEAQESFRAREGK